MKKRLNLILSNIWEVMIGIFFFILYVIGNAIAALIFLIEIVMFIPYCIIYLFTKKFYSWKLMELYENRTVLGEIASIMEKKL